MAFLNSSGYSIRERDLKTNEPILASYDVRTGQRTGAQSPEKTHPDRRQLLSPDRELVELYGHRVARVLDDYKELRVKMKELISNPTEFLQLDIGAGVKLDAWMIKPKDFDESMKYPVVVYVYGEPYAQTVLDNWGAAQIDFHRVLADMGYLVVSIDNRGTPAPKGAAWRRSIFGSLGPLSTEDQAEGLKELGRARPYVDLSRVAIWGWSGGGSNTARCHPRYC